MNLQKTFLVFGGTGQTGQHFVRLALEQGHRVRVLARSPQKLATTHPDLQVIRASITDDPPLDALLPGADFVVAMLGDAAAQRERCINTEFTRQLIPAMRRNGVTRFLYQAGGLSAAPGRSLPAGLRVARSTIARRHLGQHQDNEAVMRYLTDEAGDVEWIVHRAAIAGNRPSKGTLQRSQKKISMATFEDTAAYNLRTVMDTSAVHTCDVSSYRPDNNA